MLLPVFCWILSIMQACITDLFLFVQHPFPILTSVSTFLHFLHTVVPVLLPIPCGSRGTASHSVLPHPPGFRDWSMEKATYTKLGQSGIFLIHYIKTVGKNSIFPMGLLSLEAVSSNCFWPHLPPATLRKTTDRVREQEIWWQSCYFGQFYSLPPPSPPHSYKQMYRGVCTVGRGVCFLLRLVGVGFCNLHQRELLQHAYNGLGSGFRVKTCVGSVESILFNCVQDI